VQDVLFRVPVEPFETRSQAFRDMFSLPSGDETPTEGTSDDSPIVLEGIAVDDFRALLKFLYPKKRTTSATEFSKEEWIGIHALAFMWEFHEAKEASKASLVAMDDSVVKFELAVRYEYDDWLRLAYKELTNRPDSLSLDEGERIGLAATLNIGRLREARLESTSSWQVMHQDPTIYGCPHCGKSMNRNVWYPASSERGGQCEPCGVTFYRNKATVEEITTKSIDDVIRTIVPEKVLTLETEGAHDE
ncbi:hypothetical protein SCHPADRAFT_833759, partial [Schizopora paradoxa]